MTDFVSFLTVVEAALRLVFSAEAHGLFSLPWSGGGGSLASLFSSSPSLSFSSAFLSPGLLSSGRNASELPSLPLHPAIVHFPLVLACLTPCMAIAAWWVGLRSGQLRRHWRWVVLVQALTIASGFVAMQTGEQEESRVEEIVPHAAFEAHEHAAERFVWAQVVLLLVSAAVLAVRSSRWRSLIAGFAAFALILGALLGLLAGQKGGELVYRHGANQPYLLPSQ